MQPHNLTAAPSNSGNVVDVPPAPIQTVELSRPIMSHKGHLNKLELKEPTAGTFVRNGQPFKVRVKNGDFEIDYEDKATMGFLVECTGLDEVTLSALGARDYMKARTTLAQLVLGIAGESPTQPSAE